MLAATGFDAPYELVSKMRASVLVLGHFARYVRPVSRCLWLRDWHPPGRFAYPGDAGTWGGC